MKTPLLSVGRAGQVRIAGELAGFVARCWDGWSVAALHRGEHLTVCRQLPTRGAAVDALLVWRAAQALAAERREGQG